MKTKKPNETVAIAIASSLVLFQEDELWIAHCLEFDIAAQGKTEEEATRSFERIFVGQICLDLVNNKKPFEDFQKAPKAVWDKRPNVSPKRRPLYIPRERVTATIDEYAEAVA